MKIRYNVLTFKMTMQNTRCHAISGYLQMYWIEAEIKDAKVTHYFPVISLMLIKSISTTMDWWPSCTNNYSRDRTWFIIV